MIIGWVAIPTWWRLSSDRAFDLNVDFPDEFVELNDDVVNGWCEYRRTDGIWSNVGSQAPKSNTNLR